MHSDTRITHPILHFCPPYARLLQGTTLFVPANLQYRVGAALCGRPLPRPPAGPNSQLSIVNYQLFTVNCNCSCSILPFPSCFSPISVVKWQLVYENHARNGKITGKRHQERVGHRLRAGLRICPVWFAREQPWRHGRPPAVTGRTSACHAARIWVVPRKAAPFVPAIGTKGAFLLSPPLIIPFCKGVSIP